MAMRKECIYAFGSEGLQPKQFLNPECLKKNNQAEQVRSQTLSLQSLSFVAMVLCVAVAKALEDK